MVVWKYKLHDYSNGDDTFSVPLPKGAKPLHVGIEPAVSHRLEGHELNSICLWALVDPAADYEERRFRLAGTGHPLLYVSNQLQFVGSVHMHPFVWHLFELLP